MKSPKKHLNGKAKSNGHAKTTFAGVLIVRDDLNEACDWRPYSTSERQGDLFGEGAEA